MLFIHRYVCRFVYSFIAAWNLSSATLCTEAL
jgi:hypothetical protein